MIDASTIECPTCGVRAGQSCRFKRKHSALYHTARVKACAVPKPLSEGEELFALHLKAHNIEFEREVKFDSERNWRIDFLIYNNNFGVSFRTSIAIEIEGGTWIHGRHSRGGKSFESDCRKYNKLAAYGYRLFRFTTDMVKSGEAISTVLEELG